MIDRLVSWFGSTAIFSLLLVFVLVRRGVAREALRRERPARCFVREGHRPRVVGLEGRTYLPWAAECTDRGADDEGHWRGAVTPMAPDV